MPHTYEISLGWADVYTQPNSYSAHLARLGRGKRFTGKALGTTWVQRSAGGYVKRKSLRDLGACDLSQAEWLDYLDTLPSELAGLAGHIMERIATVLAGDRAYLLQRMELMQREIVALNVRIDELDGAQTRAVGEAG